MPGLRKLLNKTSSVEGMNIFSIIATAIYIVIILFLYAYYFNSGNSFIQKVYVQYELIESCSRNLQALLSSIVIVSYITFIVVTMSYIFSLVVSSILRISSNIVMLLFTYVFCSFPFVVILLTNRIIFQGRSAFSCAHGDPIFQVWFTFLALVFFLYALVFVFLLAVNRIRYQIRKGQ